MHDKPDSANIEYPWMSRDPRPPSVTHVKATLFLGQCGHFVGTEMFKIVVYSI